MSVESTNLRTMVTKLFTLAVLCFRFSESARVRVSNIISESAPDASVVPYQQSMSLVASENLSAINIPGCTADSEGWWYRGCHPMDAEAYASGARCCGRLTSSGRGLQGTRRDFTIFRKQFKDCHDRGMNPYPYPADLDCCENLDDHETRKPVDSEICLLNGYSCSRFGAVKNLADSEQLACMCPSGRTCVQTDVARHRNASEFSLCYSSGEFNIHEQTMYSLQCIDEDSVSCGALGAIEGRYGCSCSEDKIRVGEPWQKRRRSYFFDLSKAFIRGIGKLRRWQKRELLTLNLAHEVGCVVMDCEDFNAVEDGDPMHCRCPAARFSFPRGRLPQHPSHYVESVGPFSLQEAWDNGYFCDVKFENMPRCRDGYEDKARSAEQIGMVDRAAQEPWCSCIEKFCEGQYCRQDKFGDWWYPHFCKSCGCTSTPPASDVRVAVFAGRKGTDARSSSQSLAPAMAEAKMKIKSLKATLAELEKNDRRKTLRLLQLQYHPDKVDKDVLEYSSEVFRFAQEWWDREFK